MTRNGQPARPCAGPPLHALDAESHLRDPTRKQRYVTTLFDTVAPGYDRFTRLFSFAMDAGWKRQLVGWVRDALRPGDVVLDLACGTGDMLEAVERVGGWAVGDPIGSADRGPGDPTCHPPSMIVGLDPSEQMLRLALARVAARSLNRSTAHPLSRSAAQPLVRLVLADMLAIPMRSSSVSVVTVGYGFRNTPDAAAALREVARVLKPGGWLFDLDFFRPEHRGWRRLYLWYLRATGRAIGRWWHAEPEAYGYIARSLETWVTPTEFQALLGDCGFEVLQVTRKLGGGICLHGARRR